MRRDYVLALAAGLCNSLLPACTRSFADATPAAPPAVLSRAERTAPPPTALAQAGSPYHPLAPLTFPKEITNEPPAEQVNDPGPVQRTEALPPPDRAPEKFIATQMTPEPAPPAEQQPVKEPPLITALRCVIEHRSEEARNWLEHLDKGNQELLLCLLPLTARLGEESAQKADGQDVAYLVDRMESVLVPLRSRAELLIGSMCFCSQIRLFGDYEPLPEPYVFHAGERAMVYVELRNFSSQKCESRPGQVTYVTRLETSAEILHHREKVWPLGPERFVFHRDGPDVSRTLRTDYFDNCRFPVPDLPPGEYTLWIQVEDVPTKRTVRRSLDFRVTTTVGARDSSGEHGAIRMNSE